MKSIYRFEQKQLLHCSTEEVWNFIRKPEGLITITPPEKKLKLCSTSDSEIKNGSVIEYELKILPFLKLFWRSQISEVIIGKEFTDIQLKGPFSYWKHRHIISESGNGTEMHDILEYQIPLGIIGKAVNAIFVSSEIKKLFLHRKKALDRIFNT
jgi:ligand-binding SRPBCC domain-containing protein